MLTNAMLNRWIAEQKRDQRDTGKNSHHGLIWNLQGRGGCPPNESIREEAIKKRLLAVDISRSVLERSTATCKMPWSDLSVFVCVREFWSGISCLWLFFCWDQVLWCDAIEWNHQQSKRELHVCSFSCLFIFSWFHCFHSYLWMLVPCRGNCVFSSFAFESMCLHQIFIFWAQVFKDSWWADCVEEKTFRQRILEIVRQPAFGQKQALSETSVSALNIITSIQSEGLCVCQQTYMYCLIQQ